MFVVAYTHEKVKKKKWSLVLKDVFASVYVYAEHNVIINATAKNKVNFHVLFTPFILSLVKCISCMTLSFKFVFPVQT